MMGRMDICLLPNLISTQQFYFTDTRSTIKKHCPWSFIIPVSKAINGDPLRIFCADTCRRSAYFLKDFLSEVDSFPMINAAMNKMLVTFFPGKIMSVLQNL